MVDTNINTQSHIYNIKSARGGLDYFNRSMVKSY
jgi:hypothetical protein